MDKSNKKTENEIKPKQNNELNNIFCKKFWVYVFWGTIIAVFTRPAALIIIFRKILSLLNIN